MLTETPTDHWFRRWREGANAGDWRIRAGSDGLTLVAEHRGTVRLVMVAGHQIATQEGLEVLAVGCDREFPRNLDFREALHSAAQAGAVPIVPWGFGKWWFSRGSQVRQLIETVPRESLFLGDNGGRPRLGGEPRLFALARSLGWIVLPGSDPLPFRSQAGRVGSFGFALAIPREEIPAAGSQVVRCLRELIEQPTTYGGPERLGRFLVAQFLMQWRNRVRKKGPEPTAHRSTHA
jgi:hypothetical protein